MKKVLYFIFLAFVSYFIVEFFISGFIGKVTTFSFVYLFGTWVYLANKAK